MLIATGVVTGYQIFILYVSTRKERVYKTKRKLVIFRDILDDRLLNKRIKRYETALRTNEIPKNV
jgi:hypothetical protein